jgi:hypothetical protein
MKTKIEPTKRTTVYFPLEMLGRLQESAIENGRSFTKEVMQRLKQSYLMENESKIAVKKQK